MVDYFEIADRQEEYEQTDRKSMKSCLIIKKAILMASLR